MKDVRRANPLKPAIGRGRAARAISLPEQIADHVGHLIFTGRYRPGSHLTEQEVAGAFAVSRGPVRDAFHMLEKRGLVEILPRRGAHVIDMGLAEVVEIFNVRAVLLGLAAQLAATAAGEDARILVAQSIAAITALAAAADTDPLDYGTASRAAQRQLAEASGNRRLAIMLEELGNRALWRMIWGREPLDHETAERRRRSAAIWVKLRLALRRHDGDLAERHARALILASRDHTIARIAALTK